ncbi:MULTISPECIES: glycosyltransferase family 39 protein [Parafrankia]|uniref:glycosyltransferase family 39 protein n=1 Tax=Parafrankia TaxID=2994362 RepID=UPI000B850E33|nr:MULTISPECIES: glycosyltransferase family 39 protein [Parafrankia]MBE3201837.1 glycosyltransferase family 39 protein [Parafrankia sp. CH37]
MTDVAVRPAENPSEPAERVGARPGREDRVFRAALVLIIAGAVAVRFSARQPLWLDEAQSVAIARLPLSGAGPTMWDGLLEDGSPPLYYILLHGWVGLFGDGAGAVRAMSAVINLLSAVPIFLLGRQLVGERAAKVAVVLYLTSPFALYFGTETRMYSLIVLLTALGGLALERVLRDPAVKNIALLALCAGCLALTHYWCLYVLLTVGAWLIGLMIIRPRIAAAQAARRARAGRGRGGHRPGAVRAPRPPAAAAPAAAPGWPAVGNPAHAAGNPAHTAAGSMPHAAGGLAPATAGAQPVDPAGGGARAGAGASPAELLADAAGGATRTVPQWHRRGPLAGVVGLIAGGLVFAPWLSNFFSQLAHTGTPWGEPASFAAVTHAYGQWAGGPTTLGRLLLFIVTGLVAAGIAGRPLGGRFMLLDLKGLEPGRTLFFLATGTLIVAVAAGKAVGNAWADRYTATAFVPFLLVVGLGATMLADRRVFRGVVVLAALVGVVAGTSDVRRERSQAGEAAAVLTRLSKPGDVLLVCPDQLGPGLARTVPSWLKVYVVPTYAPPDRVNWVDYEERNEKANGVAVAERALAEAGSHTVFMAGSGAYRTYEELCTQVRTTLQEQRPLADEVMTQGIPARVYENYALLRFRVS